MRKNRIKIADELIRVGSRNSPESSSILAWAYLLCLFLKFKFKYELSWRELSRVIRLADKRAKTYDK